MLDKHIKTVVSVLCCAGFVTAVFDNEALVQKTSLGYRNASETIPRTKKEGYTPADVTKLGPNPGMGENLWECWIPCEGDNQRRQCAVCTGSNGEAGGCCRQDGGIQDLGDSDDCKRVPIEDFPGSGYHGCVPLKPVVGICNVKIQGDTTGNCPDIPKNCWFDDNRFGGFLGDTATYATCSAREWADLCGTTAEYKVVQAEANEVNTYVSLGNGWCTVDGSANRTTHNTWHTVQVRSDGSAEQCETECNRHASCVAYVTEDMNKCQIITQSVPDGIDTETRNYCFVKQVSCHAPDVVSVENDPLLTNMDGQKFDVARPGEQVLIRVPRGAPDGATRLRLSANIVDMLGKCKADHLYARAVKLTGTLLKDFNRSIKLDLKPVTDACRNASCLTQVYVGQGAPGATEDVASKYASVLSVTPMQGGGQRIKMIVADSVTVQVDTIVLFSEWISFAYFNVAVNGVRLLKEDVGGILGHDDHTLATTPAKCHDVNLLETRQGPMLGSRGSRFTAAF